MSEVNSPTAAQPLVITYALAPEQVNLVLRGLAQLSIAEAGSFFDGFKAHADKSIAEQLNPPPSPQPPVASSGEVPTGDAS